MSFKAKHASAATDHTLFPQIKTTQPNRTQTDKPKMQRVQENNLNNNRDMHSHNNYQVIKHHGRNRNQLNLAQLRLC